MLTWLHAGTAVCHNVSADPFGQSFLPLLSTLNFGASLTSDRYTHCLIFNFAGARRSGLLHLHFSSSREPFASTAMPSVGDVAGISTATIKDLKEHPVSWSHTSSMRVDIPKLLFVYPATFHLKEDCEALIKALEACPGEGISIARLGQKLPGNEAAWIPLPELHLQFLVPGRIEPAALWSLACEGTVKIVTLETDSDNLSLRWRGYAPMTRDELITPQHIPAQADPPALARLVSTLCRPVHRYPLFETGIERTIGGLSGSKLEELKQHPVSRSTVQDQN
ncbi:hypothetical protein [Agrobacterium tumefaciens]|nr:hypothetical protein [Agrobacterium tumefaciens]